MFFEISIIFWFASLLTFYEIKILTNLLGFQKDVALRHYDKNETLRTRIYALQGVSTLN